MADRVCEAFDFRDGRGRGSALAAARHWPLDYCFDLIDVAQTRDPSDARRGVHVVRLLELPKLVHQPLREDPRHVDARGRSTFGTPEPQPVLYVIRSLAGALECRSAVAAACVRRSCPTPRPRSRPRTPSSTPCAWM